MAAGLGFKTFTTGEVLTAADTNGYLMQGINVFASTAARNAAITSPQEGQFAFTKDTNSLWYYDGAAWVASGATGDIEGVTAGTGISGGGTSGTVTVTNSMATAFTTSGDLIQATGSGTFARLGTGTSGQYLTTNGTTNSWATVASGGMTLISTTTATGTAGTVDLTSIPGTYKNLILTVSQYYNSVTNTGCYLRINSVSTGDLYTNFIGSWQSAVSPVANVLTSPGQNQISSVTATNNNKFLARVDNTETASMLGWLNATFYDYTSTTAWAKLLEFSNSGYDASGSGGYVTNRGHGKFGHTAAISSIQIIATSGNINGVFKLYGVS